MSDTNPVSRRGFLAALGAGAAASAIPTAALPLFPALAQQPGPGRWTEVTSLQGTTFRAAYMAEVERFALTLEAEFRAGKLRAFRSGDDSEYEKDKKGEPTWQMIADSPHWEVERLCADHFGLTVKRSPTPSRGEAYDGDAEAAYLVLACSPRAEATEDAYFHPCYHAQSAAAWDVIAYARAAGWYVPASDETEDPAIGDCPYCDHGLWAHGDGANKGAGCQVYGCECQVRHTRHVPGVLA